MAESVPLMRQEGTASPPLAGPASPEDIASRHTQVPTLVQRRSFLGVCFPSHIVYLLGTAYYFLRYPCAVRGGFGWHGLAHV